MKFDPLALRRHVRSPAPELLHIVTQVLQAGLADLAPAASPDRGQALRHACRSALERLWDRRDALARSLAAPGALPPIDTVEDFRVRPRLGPDQTEQERNVVQLNAATSLAALVLRSSLQSTKMANAPARPDAPWPFSPQSWAMALRRIVELASPEHTVRIELMRIGTRLLCRHFVDAWCRTSVRSGTQRRRDDVQDGHDSLPGQAQLLPHRVTPVHVDEVGVKPKGRWILGAAWLGLSACLVTLMVGCGGGSATGSPAPTGPTAPVVVPGAPCGLNLTAGDNETTLGVTLSSLARAAAARRTGHDLVGGTDDLNTRGNAG